MKTFFLGRESFTLQIKNAAELHKATELPLPHSREGKQIYCLWGGIIVCGCWYFLKISLSLIGTKFHFRARNMAFLAKNGALHN